jgi:hypothetical protein
MEVYAIATAAGTVGRIPQEFKARWEKVFERIGTHAVAVLQGVPQDLQRPRRRTLASGRFGRARRRCLQPRPPLRSGHVFSIDPQLRVPEENHYVRYEDVIAVTETGLENFTSFLPPSSARLRSAATNCEVVPRQIGQGIFGCLSCQSVKLWNLFAAATTA